MFHEVMPKTRKQKEETVASLKDKLGKMRSMVFAGYEGLPVKDIEALRRELKKEGIDYTVVKKTLLARAVKEANLNFDPKELSGNFATVISYGDEIAPAKALAKFAKNHEALKISGGVLDGVLLSAAKTLALSKLPGKLELLSKLVGSLNAPVSGFVNVLAGNLRGLLTVMNAIKDKKTA
ncbi:50S ribosomal protein L10 [Candidatus Uhrbacteria bacterium]|nr:50S ribosomal protein L10 [Candidatus Uhrbacteria bacterium]